MVAASAVAGLVLRSRVSPTAGRVLLGVGLAALALGLAVSWLVDSGRGALGLWTGVYVYSVLLVVAGLALPFGLAASWGRAPTDSDAG